MKGRLLVSKARLRVYKALLGCSKLLTGSRRDNSERRFSSVRFIFRKSLQKIHITLAERRSSSELESALHAPLFSNKRGGTWHAQCGPSATNIPSTNFNHVPLTWCSTSNWPVPLIMVDEVYEVLLAFDNNLVNSEMHLYYRFCRASQMLQN